MEVMYEMTSFDHEQTHEGDLCASAQQLLPQATVCCLLCPFQYVVSRSPSCHHGRKSQSYLGFGSHKESCETCALNKKSLQENVAAKKAAPAATAATKDAGSSSPPTPQPPPPAPTGSGFPSAGVVVGMVLAGAGAVGYFNYGHGVQSLMGGSFSKEASEAGVKEEEEEEEKVVVKVDEPAPEVIEEKKEVADEPVPESDPEPPSKTSSPNRVVQIAALDDNNARRKSQLRRLPLSRILQRATE